MIFFHIYQHFIDLYISEIILTSVYFFIQTNNNGYINWTQIKRSNVNVIVHRLDCFITLKMKGVLGSCCVNKMIFELLTPFNKCFCHGSLAVRLFTRHVVGWGSNPENLKMDTLCVAKESSPYIHTLFWAKFLVTSLMSLKQIRSLYQWNFLYWDVNYKNPMWVSM